MGFSDNIKEIASGRSIVDLTFFPTIIMLKTVNFIT